MARVLLGLDPGPPLTHGLLRVYLEAAGHQVHELGDGEALLAEAATGVPADALVLDTALPNLDGFQVLARLQAQAAPPRMPILVVSTIPAQLGRRLVESMGAAVYLCKPFTFEALRLALEDVLAPPGEATAADGAPATTGPPTANGAAFPSRHNGTAPRQLRNGTTSPTRAAGERPAG
jgi:DNA-binding response OmpR family regulator